MPVCVAGMHRSGTSLVAGLLGRAGVWLGPENDLYLGDKHNRDGYFENFRFVMVNEELLRGLGGGWDLPPEPEPGWESSPDLDELRSRAAEAVAGLKDRPPWGWKDPRNSLTIRFWLRAVPDLRVLLCVRHPGEVAQSLQARNLASSALSNRLWLAYNASLLEAVPNLVVTHFESYLEDPVAELTRVLEALGVPADEDRVRQAAGLVKPTRRHQVSREPIAPELAACYSRLCEMAGPVFAARLARPLEEASPEPEEPDPTLEPGLTTIRAQHEAKLAALEAGHKKDLLAARAELAAAEAERDSLVRQYQAVRAELDTLKSGQGWLVLQGLWRLRRAVAPDGSRREQAVRGLVNVVRRASDRG